MPIHTKKWLNHVLNVRESLPENTEFNDIIKIAVDKWGLKLSNKKKKKHLTRRHKRKKRATRKNKNKK